MISFHLILKFNLKQIHFPISLYRVKYSLLLGSKDNENKLSDSSIKELTQIKNCFNIKQCWISKNHS